MPEDRRLRSLWRPSGFEILPWVPTLFGVGLMLALLVFSIVISLRHGADRDRAATDPALLPPPPAVVEPTPPASTAPAPPTPVSPSPTAAAPAAPNRPTPTQRSAPDPEEKPPPTTPPPKPDVTGRYRVVESFNDSFIGEVLVSNATTRARDWTVRLRFPANVGDLRTFWVDGAPQPTLRRSGAEFVFTSGAPVAGRGTAPLRFQFSRTGTVNTPAACSVNGAACSR